MMTMVTMPTRMLIMMTMQKKINDYEDDDVATKNTSMITTATTNAAIVGHSSQHRALYRQKKMILA